MVAGTNSQSRFRANVGGFTLIEISAVIAIVSMLLVGMIQSYRMYDQVQDIIITKQRMADIQAAIEKYRAKNSGRYPCAASLIAPPDSAQYGVATACAPGPPPGVFFDDFPSGAGHFVHTGAVPGRTLNLSDEKMYDAWGRRFTYAISRERAVAPLAAQGVIFINDMNGNSVITPAGSADYVLISHGPDGVGGYTHAGKLFAPCNLTTKDGENCNFGIFNLDTRYRYSLERSTAPGAGWYDDTVALPFASVATAPTTGSPPDRQIFNYTGGGQTWTKPATLGPNAVAFIQCWGGGGGGGKNWGGGGGGGGGAYVQKTVPLSSLGATEPVLVGAGGPGGFPSGNGASGGPSQFGMAALAGGGDGGIQGFTSDPPPNNGLGGAGGVSFGGDSGSIDGQAGSADRSRLAAPIYYLPGYGGDAGGGGGTGGDGGKWGVGVGQPGIVPGGGGGGGNVGAGAGRGGNGAAGRCIVTSFD